MGCLSQPILTLQPHPSRADAGLPQIQRPADRIRYFVRIIQCKHAGNTQFFQSVIAQKNTPAAVTAQFFEQFGQQPVVDPQKVPLPGRSLVEWSRVGIRQEATRPVTQFFDLASLPFRKAAAG